MHGDRVHDARTRRARRARLELVLAAVFGVLTVLALVVPAWIEHVSAWSPDGGDGEAELWLALPFGLVSLALGALSWRSRRRVAGATD